MTNTNSERILGSARSVEALYPTYEQVLAALISEQDVALSSLINWREAYQASGINVMTFLKGHEDHLVGVLSDGRAQITESVGLFPEILHGLPDFSPADRAVYQKAVKAYSISSAQYDIGRYASGAVTQQALLGALDKGVLAAAVKAYSISSAQYDIGRYASGATARDAMLHSLDSRLYNQATKAYSASSAKYDIDKYASSLPARDAMLSAIDRKVLNQARSSYSLSSAKYDIDKYASANVTDEIMHEALRDKFAKDMATDTLRVEQASFIERHQVPWYVDLNSPPTIARLTDTQGMIETMREEMEGLSKLAFVRKKKLQSDIENFSQYAEHMQHGLNWLAANPRVLYDWQTLKDRIENEANGGKRTSGSRQRAQTPPPPGEQRQPQAKSQAALIYEQTLAHFQNTDRSIAHTLKGYPRAEVLKVINTVLLARGKSQQKGEEIDDREILIRYMRRSNNTPQPDPEHVRGTQIMLTLMGDKVSGKLPF